MGASVYPEAAQGVAAPRQEPVIGAYPACVGSALLHAGSTQPL